jgi:hypothetical protein
MTHFAIAHELHGTREDFWKIFFHEPYNDELYQRIGVKERTRIQFDEDERTIRFAVRVVPRRDLPPVIKKIVGGDLGYTEFSTYHKGKDEIDVRIEPSLLKDRTRMRGLYRVVELEPRRLRRTFEGDIHVDVPLVGRKVEATVLDDVRRSYDIAAAVTNEWLKKGL